MVHITQGNEITCPFQGCGLKYRVLSSFSSRLSRRHKETTNRNIMVILNMKWNQIQNITLATGPRDLATGPRDLATGPRDLATGPRDLATGPRDLATGRRDLATGHRDMVRDAGTLLRDPGTLPRDAF